LSPIRQEILFKKVQGKSKQSYQCRNLKKAILVAHQYRIDAFAALNFRIASAKKFLTTKLFLLNVTCRTFVRSCIPTICKVGVSDTQTLKTLAADFFKSSYAKDTSATAKKTKQAQGYTAYRMDTGWGPFTFVR